MKPVAKVMASETLARMLAVAAMLVIVGFIFFALNVAGPILQRSIFRCNGDDVFVGGTT
jgi:hypothetical protein